MQVCLRQGAGREGLHCTVEGAGLLGQVLGVLFRIFERYSHVPNAHMLPLCFMAGVPAPNRVSVIRIMWYGVCKEQA